MVHSSEMEFQSVLICAGDYRCSGLLFDKNWVLTHGSLLGNSTLLDLKSVTNQLSLPTIKFPSLFVILNDGQERLARLTGLWRCPLVAGALDKLLEEWVFGSNETDNAPQAVKSLLPLFVVLHLGTTTKLSRFSDTVESPSSQQSCVSLKNVKAPEPSEEKQYLSGYNALVRLSKHLDTLPPLGRGQKLVLKSTPFGSKFFLDAWSIGIVSCIGGPGDCVLLTDLRSAPGCEGGPIFRHDGSLVGMVISSLCWWRGEWIGFTLGVLLHPVLWQLEAGYFSPKPPLAISDHLLPAGVDSGVVLIHCGSTWGSGVVLDSDDGIILTCSHVLRQTSSIRVHNRNYSRQGKMIHRTKDGVPFDVGIVSVGTGSSLEKIRLAKNPPIKGEPVLAAGFPLISKAEGAMLLPVVSRGYVSHVAPTMLQTTCCIQSGASGGAILRPSGELLGLIVCNARDTNTDAIYPHINLCIQVSAIEPVLQRYLDNKDPVVLTALECKDDDIQRLWALKLAPNSKL